MPTSIPTSEPFSARAGDSWRWEKTLADFPASTWALVYTLINASAKKVITAAADGDDHLVEVLPADTATIAAGRYDWVAYVADGTDQYHVGAGVIDVLPNLSAAETFDGRSYARRMLEAIDAILERRATSDQLDLVQGSAQGRSVTRRTEDMIKLRQYYAAAVAQEEQAKALANGVDTGRIMQVRFR